MSCMDFVKVLLVLYPLSHKSVSILFLAGLERGAESSDVAPSDTSHKQCNRRKLMNGQF